MTTKVLREINGELYEVEKILKNREGDYILLEYAEKLGYTVKDGELFNAVRIEHPYEVVPLDDFWDIDLCLISGCVMVTEMLLHETSTPYLIIQ